MAREGAASLASHLALVAGDIFRGREGGRDGRAVGREAG